MLFKRREPEKEVEQIIHPQKEELPVRPWWIQDESEQEAETLTAMEVSGRPDKKQRAVLRRMRATVKRNERIHERRSVRIIRTREPKSVREAGLGLDFQRPKVKIPQFRTPKIVRGREETAARESAPRLRWIKERTEMAEEVMMAAVKPPGIRGRKLVENGLFAVAALLLLAGLVTYVPTAISVNSNPKEKRLPISAVDTKENKVALTFDATGRNDDVEGILAILEKHDVKASFFISGGWFEKYPESVALIAEKGHDIGSLGQSNTSMKRMPAKQIEEELMVLHNKVLDSLGMQMRLFRPPHGDYNEDVLKAADGAGYHCVMWNIDSLDWKDYGVESMVETVVKHKDLKGGSIVLLHVDAKYTSQALESIILGLKEGGFELVSLSELLTNGGYDLENQVNK